MSVAVRIAEAYTGKDIVLVCGYHGWHDWYLTANMTKGDPLADVHLKSLELAGTNLFFHYNNIEGFQELVEKNRGKVASVVMEPVCNEYPSDDFLEKIRGITSKEDIILVFDEITAGFRLCTGESHMKLGTSPDIAVFARHLQTDTCFQLSSDAQNVWK